MNKYKIAVAAFALLSAASIIGVTGCKKNSFRGTGAGKGGDITVDVSLADGKITAVKVVSENEDYDGATEEIIKAVVAKGSTDGVEAISGATLTSNGVLSAINAAVAASKGAAPEKVVAKDTECDIVIVGAGGAGLVASIEAASNGKKVIVLEKMGIVGGNTNLATGGINASYTKFQEKLGITDSVEVFYNDTMKGGHNKNDPALVKTMVDNSAAMVDWLTSDLVGADLSDVGIFGGATNKRIHRPEGGKAIGAYLVPVLKAAAEKQGVDIRLNSKVVEIVKEGNKAAGVVVENKAGKYTVKAKAVILATGGFGANSALVEKYVPSLAGFGTTNHAGATGDAFAMVEKFNADFTDIELIQTHPTVVPVKNSMITEAVRGNGAILVNREGKRFGNEMATRDVMSAGILAQTGKTAYLLFDQGVRESLKAIEGYVKNGLTVEGATLKELAGKLSIPADALEAEIAKYNGYVKAGNDPEFNRNPNSFTRSYKKDGVQVNEDTELVKGPFYAIEVGPAIHHTMGGLKINPKAEVIAKDGNPIPGLYAAGEVTGGVHGDNRLGGNAVADICIFGKIAADSAMEYIK